MASYKISAVSYTNTLPFVFGINKSGLLEQNFALDVDIPSVCAEKLLTGKADIGLVPVAVLPKLVDFQVVSDYCIGAKNKVATVLLLSDVPLTEISSVLLDYQSRTSVALTQILAKNYWKITPKWLQTKDGYETKISGRTAGVVIGDRAFRLAKKYPYCYDLSAEWFVFMQMPFVFAVWVARKSIDAKSLGVFNDALKFGIANIDKSIEETKRALPVSKSELYEYLTKNISYCFDDAKRTALKNFLHFLQQLT